MHDLKSEVVSSNLLMIDEISSGPVSSPAKTNNQEIMADHSCTCFPHMANSGSKLATVIQDVLRAQLLSKI